jgi:hypothetical protein
MEIMDFIIKCSIHPLLTKGLEKAASKNEDVYNTEHMNQIFPVVGAVTSHFVSHFQTIII